MNKKSPSFFFREREEWEIAFPQIKTLSVNITENGYMGKKGVGTKSYNFSITRLPNHFIKCQNSSCKGYGFNIGDILLEMVSNKEESKEDLLLCDGEEKIGTGFRSCINSIDYKINTTYKD